MIVTRGMEYANWASLGVLFPFLESGSGDQHYQNYKDLGGEEWYPNESEGASSEGGMDAGRVNTAGIHYGGLSRRTVILPELWFLYSDFLSLLTSIKDTVENKN